MMRQLKASLESLGSINAKLDKKVENDTARFDQHVYNGRLNRVKTALQIKPQLATRKIIIKDFSGLPLQLAAIRGHTDIIILLVRDYRLSIYRRHKGNKNILMNAAESSHNEKVLGWQQSIFRRFFPVRKKTVFEVLVQLGIHIDDKDNDGNTALMLACLRDHVHIARKLIELGADPLSANWNGNTPLDIAMRDKTLAALFRSEFYIGPDESKPVDTREERCIMDQNPRASYDSGSVHSMNASHSNWDSCESSIKDDSVSSSCSTNAMYLKKI